MNEPDDFSEELTPAERRLREHLNVLREDAPRAPGQMVAHVVRTARWQRAIRRPMLTIGALTSSIASGLRLLLRPPRSRS